MTLTIPLDGTLDSSLDWKKQAELATACVNDGTKIFWEINLLSRLQHSLSNESQFLSLKLSIEHFNEFLWSSFQEATAGISLYHGSADFSEGYLWDEEEKGNLKSWLQGFPLTESLKKRYCAQAAAEYLDLLAGYLPMECQSFVQLSTQRINDPLLKAQLTSKELYPHIEMLIDGKSSPACGIGICLPSIHEIDEEKYTDFPAIFDQLEEYRIIPEPLLINEWHGLDTLYVSEKALSAPGRRMLQGFEAAGGTVRYL